MIIAEERARKTLLRFERLNFATRRRMASLVVPRWHVRLLGSRLAVPYCWRLADVMSGSHLLWTCYLLHGSAVL